MYDTTMITVALLWSALLVASSAASEVPSAFRGSTSSRQLLSDSITKLRLISTVTNSGVADLTDGAVIDLNNLGMTASGFNIEAVVSDSLGDIQSIKFLYNNVPIRTESIKPYAMCGDASGAFGTCTELVVGEHTITAIPFSERGGNGQAGSAVSLTFTIIQEGTDPAAKAAPGATSARAATLSTLAPTVLPNAAPTDAPTTALFVPVDSVVGLQLIYTGEGAFKNQPVVDLGLNSITHVDVSGLGLTSTNFNIKVVDVGGVVKSVRFSSGHHESYEPFAYCGAYLGNFGSCTDLKVGVHTVTVTPFPEALQKGIPYPDLEVTFSISL